MIWKLLIVLCILLTSWVYLFIYQKQSVTIDLNIAQVFKPSPPSLNQIFSKNHKWEATLSAKNIRAIIATGDIIPARSVNFKALEYKDFTWPYLKTYQLTQNADITFANLESPQIKNCSSINEGMIFCGDFRNIEGLKFAGVDIVSLANNHAGNYGTEGVKETLEHLKTAGIDTIGTSFSNLIIQDVRGIKFAFLGFNDITKGQQGIADVDEEKIKTEITRAKKQADVVIVTFHWGTEYQNQPDDRQKYLGHLAIDSGADLIIGNHPHWIQPIEIYQDKLITYAHGNFVFDQMWSQKTREGVIGKYTFFDNQLIDVEYLPIQIDNYGQPYFIEGKQKQSILNHMKSESLKL